MPQAAVIGNAGGGESTLRCRLREAIGLLLHYIDLIQWKPGGGGLSVYNRERTI